MKTDAIKVACSNCNLRELCMPIGLSAQDLERIDELVARLCFATAMALPRCTPYEADFSKPVSQQRTGGIR